MKKQIRNLAMLLLVAIAWTGCTDEIAVENKTTDTTKGTTLIASMGDNAPQTRIDYTDNGTSGMDLKWSAGDEFTVFYKSGGAVGNFVLKSGEGTTTGVFEAVGSVTLHNGYEYIAVYPAISSAYVASYSAIKRPTASYIANGNNDMTQLNDMLHIEAPFTYTNGAEISTKIAFKHQYAMLTIKLSAGTITDVVGKISMHSSTNDFSDVQFITTVPTSDITAYTMMKPASGDRDITFAVTTATGKVYTQTISTSKEYVAGKRYTATLDNLTELTGVDLASFAASAPNGDIWVITDADTPTADKFTNINNQLKAIESSGRKIELIFSNIKAIPANAMTILQALASVSCPQVTSLGAYAFHNNTNLTSVYFPNLTNISSNSLGKALTSIYLPKLPVVPTQAFSGCSNLTTVYLPKVTSIANTAFPNCSSLKSFTVATEATLSSLGTSIFAGLTTLTNITVTTSGGTTADNSWTVGNQSYGPFRKVNIISAP
ncbi:leucine-rich repeat protein [Bacteroides sp.]|uniref:leucine-rich repeat protein n=1 Tax=Bacteroides sp. TaxID=29523 RepID=UPI00260C56EC|nr:leucine-rich repeat protein [Bacteroides sp.]